MAGEPSNKRRSVRQADTRKRSKYAEPDTDDDFAISDAESLGEGPSDKYTALERATKKVKTSRRRPGRPAQRETRSKAARKAAERPSPRKKSKPGRPKSRHVAKPTKAAPVAHFIPSDEKIPKWETLPYEILTQIFAYAFAAELETEREAPALRRAHHPNTWIMRSARKVCRAFAEPALTAYYQAPILLGNRWLEDLAALVQQPDDSLMFKYKMKVKSLEISARCLAESRGEKHLLNMLVSSLPQLTELVITHPLDEPPFEYEGRAMKWKYTDALFDALDAANIHLTKWRWNWNLMKEDIIGQPWHVASFGDFLTQVHTRTSFQTLRSLEISQLPSVPPFPELIESEEDPAGEALARAICALPDLKSLSLESCDCLTNQILQNLPSQLEELKIINCATLTSDMLYSCLSQSGFANLKVLILNHNPFLDLAFLTSLRDLCPNLQVLKMDMFDHRENYYRHFGEPKYEQLLLEDEVPTWPSTLRNLELVHMQKWGAGSAQNLFRSLVESADSLPDLRILNLQAHINISWRDRAAFRDQWIERLQRVYLRRDEQPNRHLASLKAWRIWTNSQRTVEATRKAPFLTVNIVRETTADAGPNDDNASDKDTDTARRSKRISDQILRPKSETPPQPEPPQRSKLKAHRKRGRSTSDAISVTSRNGDDNDEDGAENWRNVKERFIQGLCSVVDVRIDNQRPREEQFRERDFLDSEASGDEEWSEGAEAVEEGYAW